MYIREIINIGGILRSVNNPVNLDWDNCKIDKKTRNEYGLVLRLKRESDGEEGTASLKLKDEFKDRKDLLRQIFVSEKVMGLTLNELKDLEIEVLNLINQHQFHPSLTLPLRP